MLKYFIINFTKNYFKPVKILTSQFIVNINRSFNIDNEAVQTNTKKIFDDFD